MSPVKKRSALNPGVYAKAIVAFLAPMLLQLQQGLTKGISANELLRALGISLITALLVWAVPNSQT